MRARPQALLFDTFGTIVDWRSAIIREVADAARSASVAIDAAAFADAWRGLYQPAMEAVRSGRRAWTILDELHRESLDQLLTRFGVSDAFDAPAREHLNKAWRRLDPWPDARPALIRLKQQFFIAPCSNGNVALLAQMAKRADLPWDAILGAETARAYKPLPDAYLSACAMADAPPEACMMVAAHNDDLAAASTLGLQTAFLPRPTEYGPHQNTDLAPTGAWTIIARDLEDLADQLGA